MTDMIERVARAIAPKAWSASEDSTPQKYRRKASLAHARAAITAMREPSDEMMMEGRIASGFVSAAGCLIIWQAAIDAAMREPEQENAK